PLELLRALARAVAGVEHEPAAAQLEQLAEGVLAGQAGVGLGVLELAPVERDPALERLARDLEQAAGAAEGGDDALQGDALQLALEDVGGGLGGAASGRDGALGQAERHQADLDHAAD